MTPTSRLRVEPLEDRLAPAGNLDPTFGSGGIVSFTQSTRPLDPVTPQLSVAPDGDIFVTVKEGIARFNSDGTLDPAFGNSGVAPLPFDTPGQGLLALPGGGVLLIGSPAPNPSLRPFAVTRLTSAGAIDSTFGTAGTTMIEFDPTGETGAQAAAATLQPDGRILVVGSTFQPSLLDGVRVNTGGMAVARLTPDGQLDTTFDSDGTAVIPFPVGRFNLADAASVAVGPDGRIVLGGEAAVDGMIVPQAPPRETSWVTTPAMAAVRLLPDGQLDPTFGSGGRTLLTTPQLNRPHEPINAVRVLADGRVLLADSTTVTDGISVRLTANGLPDPTYGNGGTAIAPFAGGNGPVAIDPNGRVVFASFAVVFRLTADGAPDAGFGTNGRVNYPDLPGVFPPTGSVFPVALTNQANGDILLDLTGSPPSGSEDNAGLLIRLTGSNPPAGFVPAVAGTLTAGGPADGTSAVLNPTAGSYSASGTMTVFPEFAGQVRGTTADVNADGTPDYVFGAGPGGPPQITVLDGKAGLLLADFPAFEASFTGGLFVAAADLDGDGRAEIAASPDQGGSGRVVIFSVAPGGGVAQRASFFGIDDPNFRGGARVALGDVNGDGKPDLAVAAGFSGGPRVALFSGATLFGTPTRLIGDFFAFPGPDAVNLRNGASVALGDLDGDGFAEAIFGGGPGGAPRVFALSGARLNAGDVAGAYASPVANFFVAGDANNRGGVRVATASGDGDTKAELAVGSGAGTVERVRVYLGKDFLGTAEPTTFQEFHPFGSQILADGVYVG